MMLSLVHQCSRSHAFIATGEAPPYMKKQSSNWMHETLYDCCKAYFGWQGEFDSCVASAGGDAPTSSPIEESWCKYSKYSFELVVSISESHVVSLRRR